MTGDSFRRFFISQHPEVEAKVAAELDALGLLVTAQRLAPRSLEFADLSKLVYLGAAIKASLCLCFGMLSVSPTVAQQLCMSVQGLFQVEMELAPAATNKAMLRMCRSQCG